MTHCGSFVRLEHAQRPCLVIQLRSGQKDIALCTATKVGAQIDDRALVDQLYSQVQKMGGRRWDTSSLIALLLR
jgi:3-hydroxyisobutyrate dehydrogenase-like beta-hydroxyacid dehydrogenase